ncbi:MAG: polyribonucleotide nucleotidyltransferase [Schleiferiaceae bacterium]|nr:polyribonucleotide nucleotidyltransferase [Schleiferiaceae bacterium]
MIPKVFKEVIDLGDGREISIETGKLAKQAHGSVVVQMGKAMLLCTVVSNYRQSDVDFLPLTVDYREKFAANGRVPGGFLKREGRPSDNEVLTMRLIDRVLRPLFPKDYHAEIQLMIQMISYDENVEATSLTGLAASAAIAVSDLPFDGPISEVRVGRINGEHVINPTPAQVSELELDMVIGASMDSVVMVEGEMQEISEEEMVEAIKYAHDAIKVQIEAQLRLASQVEKAQTKREYSHETHNEEVREEVMAATYDKVYEVAKSGLPKHERSAGFKAILNEYLENKDEEWLAANTGFAKTYFHDVEYKAMRDMVLNEGKRLDGRDTTTVRPIWSEIDYLPGAHGSAVFTRGETQSLTTVTLGTSLDSNRIDDATFTGEEKFYLHYNFPPFSTGEARPIRGVSRREVGHGNLAQRALYQMVDPENPFTIRVVSDILESNGSSSMATVCAGTLALMDAGVKLVRPVSGIAMGLISDGEKFAVLSDILGDEDHLGDMDFKVTGTEKGITACQMDIKIKGLSYEIIVQALKQSLEGRLHILGEMLKTMPESRTELKPNAPKIYKLTVKKEFIGPIIGPGGKNIQGIQADTGTTVTISEVDDRGHVEISGKDAAMMDKALEMIRAIAFEPEIGEVYEGIVRGVQTYGAFVEIAPKVQGLLHISEIDWTRIKNVEDVLKEGDTVKVKLLEVDKAGKMKLSRKVLLPKPEKDGDKAEA